MSRALGSRVIFVGALVVLLFGLNRLIQLRFETGRAYAPLSSLRTDPMGAKALHDALSGMEGVDVERNYVPLNQLVKLPVEATVLMLNVRGGELFGLGDAEVVRDFVSEGGRLVVALDRRGLAYKHLDEDGAVIDPDEAEGDEQVGSEATVESDEAEPVRWSRRSLFDEFEVWEGLALRHGKHEGGSAVRSGGAPVALPETLRWREGGVLEDFDPKVWTPLFEVDGEVVVAMRDYGAGTIVVMTDSYLFSNEAMFQDREVGFLSWVTGASGKVIFEETHLGVAERTGISSLMRRYGLFEFVFAFGGVALLVVWRGSQAFLPAHTAVDSTNVVQSERSVEAGFCDLVGRHLRGAGLAREAFEIWKRSFIRTGADEARYAKELREIDALLKEDGDAASRERRPAETHFKIKTILNRKRRRHL